MKNAASLGLAGSTLCSTLSLCSAWSLAGVTLCLSLPGAVFGACLPQDKAEMQNESSEWKNWAGKSDISVVYITC